MKDATTSPAYKVPAGAELVGGLHDGMVVEEALVCMPVDGIAPPGMHAYILLRFVDGSEALADTCQTVRWLPPATQPQGGTA